MPCSVIIEDGVSGDREFVWLPGWLTVILGPVSAHLSDLSDAEVLFFV
jgi:hypothetical protein